MRLVLPAGCGLHKKMTIVSSAALVEDVAKASYKQSDLRLVREGMPAYLMLMDGMVEGWPDNERLLLAAAQAYSSYATAFVGADDTAFDLLEHLDPSLDQILVSDVGKPFSISRSHALGMIGRAMRASDILWDRVGQLEHAEVPGRSPLPVRGGPGPGQPQGRSHGAPPGDPVGGRQHPDGPRSLLATGNHRTGAARLLRGPQAVPDSPRPLRVEPTMHTAVGPDEGLATRLVSTPAPTAPSGKDLSPDASPPVTALVTRQAQQLRLSAGRRVWSTLLDLRDWPTYVYIPLLFLLLVVLPVQVYRYRRQANTNAMIVNAITHGSPDFLKMFEIVERRTTRVDPAAGPGRFPGVAEGRLPRVQVRERHQLRQPARLAIEDA